MVSEFQIGVITQTHGIRGEVKVFPTTEDKTRFKKLKEVTVENAGRRFTMKIEGVKFFRQYAIIKFEGLDSIEDAEKYKGAKLIIPREKAVALEKGEYFVADLIGLKVITDEGAALGTLKEVLPTGANDVYVVETPDKKEALLPAIKECILNIDMDDAVITVHVMDGLLE